MKEWTEEERADIMSKDIFQKKVPLATLQRNKEIWELVDMSKPNDLVRLNHAEMEALENLWTQFIPEETRQTDKLIVPADLILAGTIPLMDVIIEADIDDNGKEYTFRVVIFEDYRERLMKYLAEDDVEYALLVGVAIRWFNGKVRGEMGNEVAFPISVMKGEDGLNNIEVMFYRGVPNGYKQDEIPQALAFLMQASALSIWYGIQIALLNPVTKEAFVHNGKQKWRDSETTGNGATVRRGAKRYIKVMRLHQENFQKLVHGVGRTRERHTLAWRVIGHWRRYQNGKKVFIKPYWKGLMKDRAKEECRERKIVIPESTSKKEEKG